MSEASLQTPAPFKVRAHHYQALCGIALAAMLLVQFQEAPRLLLNPSIVLALNVLVLFVGIVPVLYRIRLSPLIVVLLIAAPQIIGQYYANTMGDPDFRSVPILDVADLVNCMSCLAYVIGLYRLQGLRFGLVHGETRGPDEAPPRVRSADSLSTAEFAPLVFTIPAFALLAEFASILLGYPWGGLDLPPRGRQLVLVTWMLLLMLFLTGHAFQWWRRLQMDRATALLMLQDIVWLETMSEQRRIQRWRAWKKLQERKRRSQTK